MATNTPKFTDTPAPEDTDLNKSNQPDGTDATNLGVEETDDNQTWISDTDADGKTQRLKTQDYAKWRAEQDEKLAQR